MTRTKLTLLIALKAFLINVFAMAISLYISLLSLPAPSMFDPEKNPNPPILWERVFLFWVILLGLVGLVVLLKNKFLTKTSSSDDTAKTLVQPLISAWVIFLMMSVPSALLTMRVSSIFSPSLRSHANYHILEALRFDDPANLAWLLLIADIRDARPLVNQSIQNNSSECLKLLNLIGIKIPKDALPNLMLQGASTGNIKMLELMINFGVNVNFQTAYGQTPLIAATEQEKLEAVEFLIKAGADVNLAPKNSYSALMIALLNDNNKILKTMINKGANIKASKLQKEFSLAGKVPNETGEIPRLILPPDSTALMLAAASANSEAVKDLLAAGAKTSETNSINYTALMYAKASACLECEQALTQADVK